MAGFMTLQVCRGFRGVLISGDTAYSPDCRDFDPSITESEIEPCWIARYSASGYMDCTDWVEGETSEEAAISCFDLYGDACEEDPTDDEIELAYLIDAIRDSL